MSKIKPETAATKRQAMRIAEELAPTIPDVGHGRSASDAIISAIEHLGLNRYHENGVVAKTLRAERARRIETTGNYTLEEPTEKAREV